MINTPITDLRAKRWGNVAKYIFLTGAFAVFAPFIWLAVGGLIGFVLFVGIYIGAWMLRPAIFTLAASTRIKFMKAAAAINPVEGLQEEHRRRSVMLDERKKALQAREAANRAFKQAIDETEREFPDEPSLPQMNADYADLVALHDASVISWQEAYIELGEFAKGIQRADRLWKTAQLQAKARGASSLSEEEWQSKLKVEVAFDTIRQNFDNSIASLSTERMQLEADRILKKKALPAPASGITIDVTSAPAKTKV